MILKNLTELIDYVRTLPEDQQIPMVLHVGERGLLAAGMLPQSWKVHELFNKEYEFGNKVILKYSHVPRAASLLTPCIPHDNGGFTIEYAYYTEDEVLKSAEKFISNFKVTN